MKWMAAVRFVALLGGASLGVTQLVGCKDGIGDPAVAELVVTPSAVSFNAVAVGSADEFNLSLRNAGQGTLVIDEVEVGGPPGWFDVQIDQLPIVIEPDQTAQVTAIYTPQDIDQVQGSLTFFWNGPEVVVPLDTQRTGGRIFVTPDPVDFGRVPGGDSKVMQVDIQNIGTADLNVTQLQVFSGSQEFRLLTDNFQGRLLSPAGVSDDPATEEVEADFFTIEIEYTPTSDGYDQGVLLVYSDDENEPEYRVDLFANGAEPCIAVTHEDGFSFGETLVGGSGRSEAFTITNCSEAENGEALNVSGLAFLEGADPEFSLDLSTLPSDPNTTPFNLEPAATTSFILTYRPEVIDESNQATLRIVSNDTAKTPLDIPITGIGSNNQCPTAVASCTVRGSGLPPSNELEVIPLDMLDCTANGSVDPDGTIVEYIWQVINRPAGSTSEPSPANTAATQFFVDLATASTSERYQLELNVVDDDGAEACEKSVVTFIAIPDEDVHVQLVWTTPGDANENDVGAGKGSDVDLRFRHPNGCWGSRWDCYFGNRGPNWGGTGTDDDPSLDIDDTDGAGPENINLSNPEAGVSYFVGVHYWDPWGFGPSDATVRIYLYGVEVYSKTRNLPSDNTFWEVAAVMWPEATVVEIDRVYPDIPSCP